MHIFKVFVAEKKRHAGKPSKLPEAKPATLEVLPEPQSQCEQIHPISATTLDHGHISGEAIQTPYSIPVPVQYTAEDQWLVEELLAWLLDGKLTHTTPVHVLAASPSI